MPLIMAKCPVDGLAAIIDPANTRLSDIKAVFQAPSFRDTTVSPDIRLLAARVFT